jgi:hypothetical protein
MRRFIRGSESVSELGEKAAQSGDLAEVALGVFGDVGEEGGLGNWDLGAAD